MRTRWIIIIFALGAGVVTWAWINALNQQVASLSPAGSNTPQSSRHVTAPFSGPSAGASTCPNGCGTVISVPSGGNFQTAIDNAHPGDIIELQAGAKFTGTFLFPDKRSLGTNPVIIRTSAPDSALPPAGTRISPAYDNVLATIAAPTSASAIRMAASAENYTFLGLNITLAGPNNPNTNPQSNALIDLGSATATQNTLLVVPQHLIFDRVHIHGIKGSALRRGIQLNSGDTTIINSYMDNVTYVGQDAQAICGWNGPGPYTIKNNYISATGENFMLGGADPSIPNLVPSNIVIANNDFAKEMNWRPTDPSYDGSLWDIRNNFEIKFAQNMTIDGNIFENNWVSSQTGYAVVIKTANQNGNAPWVLTKNLVFTNNIIRHASAAVSVVDTTNSNTLINGYTRNITFKNNLAYDIDGPKYNGNSSLGIGLLTLSPVDNLVWDHNTVDSTGSILAPGPSPFNTTTASANFQFTNNINANNQYGIFGTGSSSGTATLTKYFPGAIVDHNVIAGGKSTIYPSGNFFPIDMASVGFTNQGANNYQLLSSSAFSKKASDGTDVGVNYGALNAAQANSSAAPPPVAGPGSGGTVTVPIGPGGSTGSTGSAGSSAGTSTSSSGTSGSTNGSTSSTKSKSVTGKFSSIAPLLLIDTVKSYVRVDGTAIAADDKHFYSVVIGVKDINGNFILKQKPSLAMGGGQTTVNGPTQVGNEWIYTVSSNQIGDRTGSVTVGTKTLAGIKLTFLAIEVAKLKQDQLVNVGAVLSDLEAKLAAEQASNPTLLLASPEKLDVAQKVAVGSLITFTSIGLIWLIRRRFLLHQLSTSLS